jgi:3-oxoacyl-[acyl-carrier protein] reductase
VPGEFRAQGFVFDATGAAGVADLAEVYGFYHAVIRSADRCARFVVIGRPALSATKPETAAAAQALEGFIRALSKEIGRKGATALLLTVEPGAEDRVAGPLRFALGERSAYVTGQLIPVSKTATAPAAVRFVQPLDGKVALVTGAARGIGLATAHALAAEGAHVVIVDRPEDKDAAEEAAKSMGGSAIACDITTPGAPVELAAALRKAHGGVDIVIHNAGVTRDKTLANMKPEQWNLTVGVSLDAAMRITAEFTKGKTPLLRKDGRIVCLSSIAGIAGNFGQTNYSAAKAGVIGFVRHQAPKLAARGVTINAVAPGFIETRMTAAIPPVTREIGRRIAALGQGGLPRDVADVITFLASPGAWGVTGAVVRVCGGNMIGA